MVSPTRKARHCFTAAALIAALGTAAPAQIPQLINYQGRVAVEGANFEGTGQFKFALVDGGTTVSRTATGTVEVTNGSITAATVTNGGAGYTIEPKVTLFDQFRGGSGSLIVATIAGGAVTALTVREPGSNYTRETRIVIGAPPLQIVYQTYWANAPDTSPADGEPDAAVSLPVTKGIYSVLLGDTTRPNMAALPPGVFSNPDVRLRVWFNDAVHGAQLLTPDQRIAAVGYAMMAGGLQPGVDISAGTVTATAFTGDGSGLTNIPASAIVPVVPPAPPAGMVLIPEGTFIMGDSIGDGATDAVIVSATISAFYMDVTEVTKAQWDGVKTWAAANGYTDLAAGLGKAADHPVQTVSWYDCVKWCNARSEQAGLTPVYYTNNAQTTVYRTGNVDVTNVRVKWSANGYRLPTEAEWEKAARGGLSGQRFPWGNTISQNLANYKADTVQFAYDQGPNGYNAIGSVGGTSPATSPVGSFAANGYGLHDMAGNVVEWCWDRHGIPYAGGADPRGTDAGSNRVVRGGGWNTVPGFARCAARPNYGIPGSAGNYHGFRAVLAPGQP